MMMLNWMIALSSKPLKSMNSTLTSYISRSQGISTDPTFNCKGINDWMGQNKMVLNTDKTQLMIHDIVGTSHRPTVLEYLRILRFYIL